VSDGASPVLSGVQCPIHGIHSSASPSVMPVRSPSSPTDVWLNLEVMRGQVRPTGAVYMGGGGRTRSLAFGFTVAWDE